MLLAATNWQAPRRVCGKARQALLICTLVTVRALSVRTTNYRESCATDSRISSRPLAGERSGVSNLPDCLQRPDSVQLPIRRHQTTVVMDGGCGDDPVGWIPVHFFAETSSQLRDRRGYRLEAEFRQLARVCQPLLDGMGELQPTAPDRRDDFKDADRRNDDLACLDRFGDRLSCHQRKVRRTRQPPDEGMGVENDQRFIAHSPTAMAGSNGTS